ncbi:MAG: type III-B CRISPR-associated protein Cas10/Cmr2 [Gammaproteobacteria bacterium]|nr:type III-B CRISPR-associated protein Cas10/Cmr2 [Gammaproteobacteria bacterium]MBU1655930.1 type III-B CRISPR-associated protein Cas10/Cmr2 [Gammaproteobacteria bacterium]MBU1961802.1 type III-B CRISPR-associated protein Cas10/Cmr2 [Gammaproteobacteria bacterium]
MSGTPLYFHFTLGPVQGFVAQARRTRDFWAGSFILSWLSAVAMRAVEKQDGTIKFPEPDEAFMKALERGGTGPKQGNVPNRFKAEVASGFDPRKVEEAVRDAWRALAAHVWTADKLDEYARPDTKAIWVRQINAFWDIQWALVDDEKVTNTLDRMKNWRTHLPPDEPGVKCMMMDGWQELSGAERPGRQPGDPKGPDEFWKAIRASGMTGMATDLREGEMLCAIAYVKRRFARHFVKFEAEMLGGWKLKGWKLPNGVPSVHYMAAAPWLAKLVRRANDDASIETEMWSFHDQAHQLSGEYGEWESNVKCVTDAVKLKSGQKRWAALDGTVFFDALLENGNLWAEGKEDAKKLLSKLKALRKQADIEPVSPFYAVLLMDGDELGIHMSDPHKQKAITLGLAKFTEEVVSIVQENNGFLVYAGGDDVLAVLPLEDALSCAAALRAHYLSCFDLKTIPTSLSGAIEYAHIKMPLGKVLHDAHDLLDNIAKDGRGRDAIACRVWKPGGLTVEWAMPWECALDEKGVVIDRLAAEFRKGMEGEGGDMASKFFYRIRERFDLLNPPRTGGEAVLKDDQALELMAMEYLNSGLAREKGVDMDKAKTKIKPLLDQCRPVVRDKTKPRAEWCISDRLEPDGALLVRFLAHKGVER